MELNPRYTASVEVLELGLRVRPLLTTGLYFKHPTIPDRFKTPRVFHTLLGKAILFARDRCTFPATGPWDETLRAGFDPRRVPDFADIPHPGDVIEAGWPVLTAFATGANREAVVAGLKEKVAAVEAVLGGA
jgi:predicted ATP-grasp superfamily ATP-dependent carboligase